MFKGLFNIIIKEVKELIRDPKILLGMIIVPLIMFPLMGFAIQTSMESAEQSIEETSIALIDQDNGPVALFPLPVQEIAFASRSDAVATKIASFFRPC